MLRRRYTWQKWLAAAVFVAFIGGPIGYLVFDAASYFYGTLIEIRAMKLAAAEYRQSVARAPYLARQARMIREQLAASKAFYGEVSPEAASAAFGQTINEIMETLGGEVRSVSIEPTVRDSGLERLNLSVDISLPEDRLAQLLSALRDQHPLLFVDTLSINGAVPGTTSERLWIVMNVSAFRQE